MSVLRSAAAAAPVPALSQATQRHLPASASYSASSSILSSSPASKHQRRYHRSGSLGAARASASRGGTQVVRGGTGAKKARGTIRLRGGWPGSPRESGGRRADGAAREGQAGEGEPKGRLYFNVTGFPFPLSPFLKRRTIRREVEKGRIWTFEQEQGLGFSAVTTNTRMTVIKLKTGGLWVHAPVAPTTECLELLKELDAPVEHIVLPTFAYEHKVFVGPFARKFRRAQVWIAPRQWSWPLNLPPQLLGIFPTGVLEDPARSPEARIPPWADEIEYKVLATPEVGIGPYVEVACFHRSSRTLLVTDCVILVPEKAPEVVSPDKLLAQAENGLQVQVLSGGQAVPAVDVRDTPEFRRIGWQRMVLLILYFGPANLLDPAKSFAQVAGKLTVSPVVKTLVFDKVPSQVLRWIDSICSDWNFTRIIPCHFDAPIRASPSDLRRLFSGVLPSAAAGGEQEGSAPASSPAPFLFNFLKPSLPSAAPFPEDDLKTLRSLDSTLVSLGAVKRTDA